MLRLVLDTNVWLDWLVFDDPVVAPVKAAVAEGRAAVFIDEAAQAELVRVLAYPLGARTLSAQAQAAAIAECLRVARRDEGGGSESGVSKNVPAHVRAGERPTRCSVSGWDEGLLLPKCSDPDDQKFLELALACSATFLVTRDQALLELARRKARPLPYRIVTPQGFLAELER